MIEWNEVAERIRGLVDLKDDDRLPAIAERLRIDETTLREAAGPGSPSASITLIGAIVRLYGLDPTWVLTGRYDERTHRVALRGDPIEILSLVRAIAEGPRSPLHPASNARDLS